MVVELVDKVGWYVGIWYKWKGGRIVGEYVWREEYDWGEKCGKGEWLERR